jgi:ADP-heptose:LPS heptosyltransferase
MQAPKNQIIAVAVAPENPDSALALLQALRKRRPEWTLRYPPEAGGALLASVLGDAATFTPGRGAWIAGAHALVVPAATGCLGPTICQALEQESVVFARDSDAARQTLGIAGVLVESGDADAFLSALERLDHDPSEREAILRRGRAQAKRLRRRLEASAAPESLALSPRSHCSSHARPVPPLHPRRSSEEDSGGGGYVSVEASPKVVSRPRAGSFRKLSVVLALHGQRRVTEACLKTLRADLAGLRPTGAGAAGPEHEILCVDNASPDDTRAWLLREPDLHPVLLDENRGCPGGWNAGLRLASGDVLCVLNNDTLVHPGGIRRLAQAAWETGIAAMTGGVLNRRLEFVRMTEDPSEADYPDGCALAFRRDVWDAVGSFDEGMGLGYCEDSDWGLRARFLGYRWALCPGILTHLGGQTAQTVPEIAEQQARNHERLRLRWDGLGVGERIRVRRTGAIGDVLMATPALAALRRAKPLARIYLECAQPIAELLAGLPWLDGVSPHAPDRVTAFYDLDGAYERWEKAGTWRHPVFAFAEVLGVPVWPGRNAVRPPVPEIEEWAQGQLPSSAARRGYVACGLRSAGRPKANWGAARWQELAEAAPELTFVLLDAEPRPCLEPQSPTTMRRGATRSDHPLLALPNVVDLTGKTESLPHVLALLYRCRAAVSVDTGILHLASAAGLPVVGLLGGTPAWARAPLAGKVHLIEGRAPCFPCFHPAECLRKDGGHCLSGVSGREVADVLRRWLGETD